MTSAKIPSFQQHLSHIGTLQESIEYQIKSKIIVWPTPTLDHGMCKTYLWSGHTSSKKLYDFCNFTTSVFLEGMPIVIHTMWFSIKCFWQLNRVFTFNSSEICFTHKGSWLCIICRIAQQKIVMVTGIHV